MTTDQTSVSYITTIDGKYAFAEAPNGDIEISKFGQWSFSVADNVAITAIGKLMTELAERRAQCVPRPLDEWQEEMGPVLWWCFPIGGPPYAGTPLDDEFPSEHVTHWTPILVPEEP